MVSRFQVFLKNLLRALAWRAPGPVQSSLDDGTEAQEGRIGAAGLAEGGGGGGDSGARSSGGGGAGVVQLQLVGRRLAEGVLSPRSTGILYFGAESY